MMPKGKGKVLVPNISFDIIEHATCPVCKEGIELEDVKNIYFWRCTWKLEGILSDP